MEQLTIQKIEHLVMGEDNDIDVSYNPYISNRINVAIEPALLKVFPEDYNGEYPFIFKNYNGKNKEEKVYDIITNDNVSKVSMIKWKHDRAELLGEFMIRKKGKYNNNDYNLKYYLVPARLLEKFFEQELISRTVINGTYPIYAYNGDLDVFAFSRDNFRPKKFPTEIDGNYILDELDLAMLRLEERQLSLFKETQKKALFMEYKRIREISPRIIIDNRLGLKKPFEYNKFLGIVQRILIAWVGQRKNVYKRFINYFNLTKNDSDEFFSTENLKQQNDDFIIYENVEKNKIFDEENNFDNNNIENCKENEKKETWGFPINFLNNKRENEIRIKTNYDDDQNGFSVGFLKNKK